MPATKKSEPEKETFTVDKDQLMDKIKELIHEGNVRRILIKDKQDKVYLEIPVNVGVFGVVLAPVWVAVGTIAALMTQFKIEVVRREDLKK